MTSTQLRQEIEESYGGTRIRLDIEVEPGQYIHLGRAVVRRVANLYAAAFDVEPDEFDLADSKRFTSLDEFIEHLQDPQNPVHVICADTGDKTYQFCAVNGERLVSFGMGHELDYWHTIDVIGHPTAIEFAKSLVQPGAQYPTQFESKLRSKLALITGQPIPPKSLANDGQEFTYVLGAETHVETRMHEIDSPRRVWLSRGFGDMYRDMVF